MESLNNSIPASSLIKTLAEDRRKLQEENLDLKREVEVLKEDIVALKAYCAEAQYSSQVKDITKVANSMLQLWSNIGKKVEPLRELCDKTDELKATLDKFVKTIER